ncbi:cell division protein FtsX [Yoonia vestfoldensis]|uniref:Cell division ABC transporter subunit FtsX n=1 Tax=Yoonia vestfoldensis TaxID=245188 RepID=A0A1Y0EFN6_9RHOB|nr:FtsX-like permease family protein [Yoonia vestfoldensis]ARU02132.1 cell division ABC transporter subunit FtsX [Yoonia vestfoldensis]
MKPVIAFIKGDPLADRAVPATGMSARLTVFVAAAMAFLAVFVLALSLTAGRLASSWADDLAQTATLRLPADLEQTNAALRAAVTVLQTTTGVASARVLEADEQRALLAPWFGPDIPVESLPVPQLIEILPDETGYDAAGLRARLQAEVPGAVLDDHGAWREPLQAAAQRLRLVGWSVLALIGTVMAAMITLAAHASLAANAQIIRVLRLVGARDGYIARAFVRRFTLRAGLGAIIGTALALLVLQGMPEADVVGGTGADFGFVGLDWIWPLAIPVLSAIVAFAATRAAAARRLKEQT